MSRSEQVASVIRKGVGQVLARGLGDERVRGVVSVTRVDVGADLREATVHVSVLPAEHAELTMHGLRHAAPRIRRELTRYCRMRRIPRIEFRLDDTLKKMAELEAAFAEARSSRGKREEPGP